MIMRKEKRNQASSGLLMSDILEERLSLCVLLVIMAVISIYNIVFNDAYLDSDSIANIRYAQAVWESKSLFPDYWTGSTGLMLPNLIINLPVYAISQNLLFTHAAYNIISQYLILVSLIYLLRSFNFRKADVYQACIAVMVSLALAWEASFSIIRYTVYSHFFILAFLNLGFINRLRNENVQRFKKTKIALLFAAALIIGMSTPQYFMMVTAPLVAFCAYHWIRKLRISPKPRLELRLTLLSTALFATSFIAYVISYKFIMPRVGVPGMESALMLSDMNSIAEKMLHQLNVFFNVYLVGNVPIFSKSGLGSLLVILYVLVSVICLIWIIRRDQTEHKGIIIYIGVSLLFIYFYSAFIALPFTTRYFAFIPLLTSLSVSIAVSKIDLPGCLKKALRYAVVSCFVVMFIAFSYFHIRDYNGIKAEVAVLNRVGAYLKEQNCDMALATFWNAGRLTGVTNGEINSGNINTDCTIFNWLLDKRVFDGANSERTTAVIFTDEEMQAISEQNIERTKTILDTAYIEEKIDRYNIFILPEMPVCFFDMPSEIGDTAVNDIEKTMVWTGGRFNKDRAFIATGQGNYNMYGPYINVQEGTYRVEVSYEILDSDSKVSPGKFDIVENFGNVLRAEKNLEQGQNTVVIDEISFNNAQYVEFRVLVNPGYTIALKDLTITRIK
ncbi:MAG: hypothetical protein GX488_06500 [Clostridiales bacterium]|nr:hypothetical protein [Clostridiales bacterium]